MSDLWVRAARYHQYKFIVDGEWRHDETQPFMPDPLGNVNNWLFVRRPEAQAQASGYEQLVHLRLQHAAYAGHLCCLLCRPPSLVVHIPSLLLAEGAM